MIATLARVKFIRTLLQRTMIPSVLPYEVVGLDEAYISEPWMIWLGDGTWGLAQGFYRTEEESRAAAATCPPGWEPHVYFIPPEAYVKEEIVL